MDKNRNRFSAFLSVSALLHLILFLLLLSPGVKEKSPELIIDIVSPQPSPERAKQIEDSHKKNLERQGKTTESLEPVEAGITSPVEKEKQKYEDYVSPLKLTDYMAIKNTAVKMAKNRDEFIRILREDLSNPDNNRRGVSAAILGQWRDKNAVPELLKMIDDADTFVRFDAAWALREIARDHKDKSVLPHLMKKAEKDPSPDVRMLSALALGFHGFREALPALAKAIKDPNMGVRDNAALALRFIKDKGRIPILKEALKDSHENVRGMAIQSLWENNDKEAIPNITKLYTDKSDYVRRQVTLSFQKFKDIATLPYVRKLAGDKSPHVRLEAIKSFEISRDSRDVLLLLRIMQNDTDYRVRGHAVKMLGLIGNATLIPTIDFTASSDKNGWVKEVAGVSADRIKKRAWVLLPEKEKNLIRILLNRYADSGDRRDSARELYNSENLNAIYAFIFLLTRDTDEIVLNYSVKFVSKIGNKYIIPDLNKLLNRNISPELKSSATNAISTLKPVEYK